MLAHQHPLSLTTIAHPQEKLGEMAGQLLLEKIQAKIMAKKCQCVVYASSYPYGLSYRYDKKKKVYYPRYGGKRNYYNHENPLKKYKP